MFYNQVMKYWTRFGHNPQKNKNMIFLSETVPLPNGYYPDYKAHEQLGICSVICIKNRRIKLETNLHFHRQFEG